MANTSYVNAQSSTGTCTATAPAGPQVCWNLCSLSISMAGPTSGVNAKVTVYDGAVGGTVLFAAFLNGPGAMGTGLGSVGSIQDIPLPKSPAGVQGVQATPGNAMNIQVVGTGNNAVIINARFSDGLPTGP
jgi:hypothetical protein